MLMLTLRIVENLQRKAHTHLVTMRPSRSEFGVRNWEEVADREVARCGALT